MKPDSQAATGFIDAVEGRRLFGGEPDNYHQIRPPYPEQIYELLLTSGALWRGAATLEIGAGSGLATRRLLELGANPLTAIEPDARFAPRLASLAAEHGAGLQLVTTSFEEALLPHAGYDLVAAATSFHWIQPAIGLSKAAEVLKPGGHLALWWHVFGDAEREDLFHEATKTVLQPLAHSPSGAPDTTPFPLDFSARRREIAATACFDAPAIDVHRWTLVLTTAQVGALYATFSSIARLPAAQRDSILLQLMEIADSRFDGKVVRNMVSPVYLARRNTRVN